ncbi:MAG: AAA family ATPase [Pseudanabaena sp.]|jgi:SpoVK/Ycf46/Vps4 family AAA+-type ATPase|uniref:AAA family ATPase n=1 Tax=Pseudanabaena mucicola TaxID=71190 RepID=UPI00257629D6|nr:AAA family ATPase [Pseudanabaena mucicola]MCA6571663.1 AAA family ATPase [Pseudanabaena sp. M53BS1SP1A06MG]MCA6582401.1 AAA family ATPase [Pseudanabaena sp. M34BS1SP1A06MG]MCA6587901.1 AAA family ATPase [Pseudanabaena sp. M109S1SP1A06QC]MCA6592929.1 AAA family ATPase [Pseudanabaena sp. M38BS1SP1A06MG]MCA6597258.1 AAA family ATPase [Pseudanabaena sp. M046S1SP1A06QC]MCA6598832.1 AAA family ATPase [Pseudanabaena sp. M57BS1SP1A06MG]MCA6604644.1 AAA family ATPase [Pseudanabaena sp. M007S1SP1A0
MSTHLPEPISPSKSRVYQALIERFDLLLRAKYPLIYIVTAEEEPVEEILTEVALQSSPSRRILFWDIARGWSDNNADKGSVMAALSRIAQRDKLTKDGDNVLYVLRDLHPILKYPHNERHIAIIRELKNLSRDLNRDRRAIALTSHTLEIPAELTEEVTAIDFPLAAIAEIEYLIKQKISANKLNLSNLAWEQLVKACQGLSRTRIQRVLAKAIAEKEEVNDSDIDAVLAEKQQAIRQTGILEFFTVNESLKNVGGLDNLKRWVRIRRDAFTEEAKRYGIPTPKGALLVGIQGTGKSLSAKTIANEWRLPLLRLDIGRLFGSYVGESESRMRQMIQLAEATAPCVLWIDEIDKAFGNVTVTIDGDSGASRRVFGTLITWMQEKTAPVFIVATANNVRILPAELLRKGRFDEIFFLNLPTESERQEIFKVHLQKLRPSRLREFDLVLLARHTKNFSGAEIEQVIIDGIHRAFGRGSNGNREDFTTEDIISAIEETVPLAAIASQQIESLKQWAAESGARTASNDEELLQELRKFAINLE